MKIRRLLKNFLIKLHLGNVVSRLVGEDSEHKIFTKHLLKGKQFIIGDFTYGEPIIHYWGEGATLQIGKFCSIAGNVNIFLGGNHRIDWITTYPFSALSSFFPMAKGIVGHPATKGDIVIRNDVWIGYGATIMSGVTIGDGAVVGTMAVVSKDVKPYEIVVGNPAHPVKKRFSDEIIAKLLMLKWWDLPMEKIKKIMPLLCSDAENFFNNYKIDNDGKEVHKRTSPDIS